MKTFGSLFLRFGIAICLVALTACDSTPKKPKPVPPPLDIDDKPWNRQHGWENNARMGGMMPQSH